MAGVPMIPTAEASAPEATSATRLWYKSFANLAAGEVVASLLRLTAITWLARIGLQHFATIGAGLALGRYLTALSSSGLETIGTREAAARRKPQADLVGEVVTTRFVLAVPTFAIFATAIHVIPMDNLTRLALLGFGLMVFTSAADVRWFFVGIQRTRPIAIASVLSGALVAGGTILLVRTRADWTLAAPIYVSGDLVFALFLLVIMRRIVGRWPVGVTRDGFRHLVRASLPITLLRSVRTATISLDVVLARIMLPTAEASHYAVANHFALVGTVYLGLFYNTFLPSIMREAAQGADALRRLISVAIRRATRVGAGLALLATIIAPPFFSVLLGPKFHATIGLFQLLVWSLYALGIAGVYNSVLIAFGRQTRLAMIATIALSVNLALNLLLLPTLGAPGASVAMVVAETVALALAYRATVPLLRTGP